MRGVESCVDLSFVNKNYCAKDDIRDQSEMHACFPTFSKSYKKNSDVIEISSFGGVTVTFGRSS